MIIEVWCRPWRNHGDDVIGGVWVCATKDPAGLLDGDRSKKGLGRTLVYRATGSRTPPAGSNTRPGPRQ